MVHCAETEEAKVASDANDIKRSRQPSPSSFEWLWPST